MTDTFEVELKFPVDSFDSILEQLEEYDAEAISVAEHHDTYFQHPSRDFSQTREALRLRRIDGRPLVTYKGPKLEGPVKTRVELEWPLDPGDQDGSKLASLLKHLGFRVVSDVRKRRESFLLTWQDASVTVTLDAVDGLGTFVEIEQISVKDRIEQTQASVMACAKALGLRDPEPRSYLTMLMQQAGHLLDRNDD